MDRGNPALHEMDQHDPARLHVQFSISEAGILDARSFLVESGGDIDSTVALFGITAAHMALRQESETLDRYPSQEITGETKNAA